MFLWLQIAAEMGSLGDNKKIREEYAQLETKKKKLCREQVSWPWAQILCVKEKAFRHSKSLLKTAALQRGSCARSCTRTFKIKAACDRTWRAVAWAQCGRA